MLMIFIKEYLDVEIDNNTSVIINLINGNADILNNDIAVKIKNNDLINIPNEIKDLLKERGYLFNEVYEYLDYLNNLNKKLMIESNKTSPNFIYIPTYDCNLNCYYCFEKAYNKEIDKEFINEEKNIDNFFQMVEKTKKQIEEKYKEKYANREILITLTGGEPLLKKNYKIIEKFLGICNENHYKLSIVTNGTTIEDYIDILIKYNVKDIQITLDGNKDIHDSIRKYYNGDPSFDKIIKGIDLLSKFSDEISVRINITKKNIHSIVELKEIIQKYKNVLFYVYLLQQEGCSDYENIINELDGVKYLYKLKEENSILRERLFIDYHGYKIVDGIFKERPFTPKIKVCTAMENQYIMDCFGGIYKCWWGMGNKEYSVGNIDGDNVSLDADKLNIYKNRSIFNLELCSKCKYRYICGTACSGRLSKKDLLDGKTLCPDFENILKFVIKKEYEFNLKEGIKYDI